MGLEVGLKGHGGGRQKKGILMHHHGGLHMNWRFVFSLSLCGVDTCCSVFLCSRIYCTHNPFFLGKLGC